MARPTDIRRQQTRPNQRLKIHGIQICHSRFCQTAIRRLKYLYTACHTTDRIFRIHRNKPDSADFYGKSNAAHGTLPLCGSHRLSAAICPDFQRQISAGGQLRHQLLHSCKRPNQQTCVGQQKLHGIILLRTTAYQMRSQKRISLSCQRKFTAQTITALQQR